MQSVKTEFHYLSEYPDAVPTVARWWFEAWGPTESCSTANALAHALAANLHRDELPVQVVAVENGDVVGVAVLKDYELKQEFYRLRYWLGNVFVRPESRRRGVGSALVKRAEGIAHAMGITALHLATDRSDGGLYARLGYEILERTQEADAHIVVMARQLDEPVQIVQYDESSTWVR
jgi:predicted N-acetyltransferase YhbS